ncbi:MAG: FAD:protein FMN transferase, partial [Candidatus Sumerlaeota bacterium]|nr:FAD:protein FMN transferase [Candidatus Sumerlaeota bacterium]
ETRAAMGTYVRLTAFAHDDEESVRRAFAAAFGVIERLDPILSRHRSDSALSRLNAAGGTDGAPAPLTESLRIAEAAHRQTEGAFDPTIEPLERLESIALRDNAAPSAKAIDAALARVGLQHVDWTDREIAFRLPGMGLDLDGVAKGYILDAVAAELAAAGLTEYLVEGGGDMASAGRAWRVGIWNPAANSTEEARLTRGAMTTSGNYQYGRSPLWGHIIDPFRGRPVAERRSVTVCAPTCALADAWSTGLAVLEPDRALALAERAPDVECLLIDARGEIRATSGFPRLPAES